MSAELSARVAAESAADQPSDVGLGLRWRRRGRISLGLEGEARLQTGGELALRCALLLWRPGSRLYCRLRAEGRAGRWTDGASLILGWEAQAPGRAFAARGATARGP